MIKRIYHQKITLGFGLYAFILFFAMSTIERFSNEFIPAEISYPSFLAILMDWNRTIFGLLLLVLIGIAIRKKKSIRLAMSFYWAPILLHLMLSVKLLVFGNEYWIISFIGAFSLIGIFYACSQANIQISNFEVFEKFSTTLVLLFISLAATQYLISGTDNMQFGERYFFFTAHANQAGLLWAFSSLTILFLLLNGSMTHLVVKSVILLVCLYFLYLTQSRGAMLSLAVGISAILILGSGSSKNKLIISVLIMSLAVSYFFTSASSGEMSFYTQQVERGNTRSEVYSEAIDGFLEYPIFGIPYEYGRPTFVENTLLSFMKSAGIFGMLLCVLFYTGAISILLNSLVKVKKSSDQVPRYFIALFLMMLMASIFEAYPINFVSTGSFITIFSGAYLIQYVRKSVMQYRKIQ